MASILLTNVGVNEDKQGINTPFMRFKKYKKSIHRNITLRDVPMLNLTYIHQNILNHEKINVFWTIKPLHVPSVKCVCVNMCNINIYILYHLHLYHKRLLITSLHSCCVDISQLSLSGWKELYPPSQGYIWYSCSINQ